MIVSKNLRYNLVLAIRHRISELEDKIRQQELNIQAHPRFDWVHTTGMMEANVRSIKEISEYMDVLLGPDEVLLFRNGSD